VAKRHVREKYTLMGGPTPCAPHQFAFGMIWCVVLGKLAEDHINHPLLLSPHSAFAPLGEVAPRALFRGHVCSPQKQRTRGRGGRMNRGEGIDGREAERLTAVPSLANLVKTRRPLI
jgi:hypothetical protein